MGVKSNALKYRPLLLAHARKEGLTAAQVGEMDYRAVAAACGVKIEANGDSPSDFFYQSVRIHVVNVLAQEEGAVDRAAKMDAVMDAIAASPLTSAYQVSADPDGTIRITPPKGVSLG